MIRRFGPISREGIHEMTHIRRSTTSQLVRELLGEGRVLEAGRNGGAGQAGRKQVLLRLNETYRYIAAVEFDEENVLAGVLDLLPGVRHTVSEPAHLRNGAEGLLKQLIACIRRALQDSGLKRDQLLAIGIADPVSATAAVA